MNEKEKLFTEMVSRGDANWDWADLVDYFGSARAVSSYFNKANLSIVLDSAPQVFNGSIRLRMFGAPVWNGTTERGSKFIEKKIANNSTFTFQRR